MADEAAQTVDGTAAFSPHWVTATPPDRQETQPAVGCTHDTPGCRYSSRFIHLNAA